MAKMTKEQTVQFNLSYNALMTWSAEEGACNSPFYEFGETLEYLNIIVEEDQLTLLRDDCFEGHFKLNSKTKSKLKKYVEFLMDHDFDDVEFGDDGEPTV